MHEVAAQASADSDQGDKERKQQLQRGYEELRWSSACREAYVSHITVGTGVACNGVTDRVRGPANTQEIVWSWF